jgi:hypothetical protein
MLVTAAVAGPSCGEPTAPAARAAPAAPTPPAPPVSCTSAITLGLFANAPPSPGQGLEWTAYFAATLLPAQGTVYIVDINGAPIGCAGGAWSAVSASTGAVQLSPAGGSGRGQVELFMPANAGPQRTTSVTIAGQTATITQAGR